MISLKDVYAARERISRHVKRTALIRHETLSRLHNTHLYLKLEMFQKTGSFKIRGAFNKLLALSDEERSSGVVAVSGGNHAQAVAFAASTLGLSAVILMPENTSKNYLQATQDYGARIVLTPSINEAFRQVESYQKEGMTFVHPFNDPLVMAGQGIIGLELIEDLPELTDVIVSIGGGGLMSGVAAAVKSLKPAVRIWGVETKGADAMSQALAAGHPVNLSAITSIAKTLGAPSVSEETLKSAQKHLEKVIVVSDAETVSALGFLLERAKILTEPAASCTLAAVGRLSGRFGAQNHVALILCGGNISLDDLCSFREKFN